ncbi:MAG: superoxide dismutase [Fe] [Cyanobacteria bacterium QS_8_64_29]|nr:MAG: superoxide dismutase [Fe] [Cyanobacteria bacterium QS_8_64_29]
MSYELPPLPYNHDALEPHMSARTLEFHHDKHHAKYVNQYNQLSQEAGMVDRPIEEVIKATYNDSSRTGLFNNAAQAWNHTFFFNCMSPDGGGAPSGSLGDKIAADFGNFDNFKAEFKQAGATQFGSGWAWLVMDEGGNLKVTQTPNAINPLPTNETPLLTCDVWEHAYYLDYQNRKPDFLDAFLNELVNWAFVGQQLEQARQTARV